MTNKFNKSLQIPFNETDNCFLSYPEIYGNRKMIWLDNYEFTDKMQVLSYSRGRSSALFWLKSLTDSKEYPVFISDMETILKNCDITKGVFEGTFTFCKKGQNYGLKLIQIE